ncbi:MAG: SDR family NAD(P)-dependent oxidoreductase [Rhodospirillaceae bacterium]|nr:SDR family NAD(P)-dependent oxidoreductase [Rhodospirillaceae bacterium]
MKSPTSILITGASSGIGAALALEYATPGIFLAISGRNADRLEAVAEAAREKGAEVAAEIIDVTDMIAMKDWTRRMDDAHPLDLVIANAGISGGGDAQSEDGDTTRDIFAVNMAGVLNTVLPIIAPMQKRRAGQIALISSLAGFTGLPSAPAYSASKVMVKAWGEAIRGGLKKDGITVSVVCPGFVKSRITDQNTFSMPLLMSAPKAARIICRRLQSGRAVIAFPWPLAAIMWVIAVLPPCWRLWILGRMPEKG